MATQTLTLTDFLLARIAEDEAKARSAVDGSSGPWSIGPKGDCGCCERVLGLGVYVDDRQAAHVARHDPAHVLAECEAKREIVALIESTDSREIHPDAWAVAKWAVRILATVHADHPDYREEWKP